MADRDDDLADVRAQIREIRADVRELHQALLTVRGTAKPARLGIVGWATAWSLTAGPIIGAYLATR